MSTWASTDQHPFCRIVYLQQGVVCADADPGLVLIALLFVLLVLLMFLVFLVFAVPWGRFRRSSIA